MSSSPLVTSSFFASTSSARVMISSGAIAPEEIITRALEVLAKKLDVTKGELDICAAEQRDTAA